MYRKCKFLVLQVWQTDSWKICGFFVDFRLDPDFETSRIVDRLDKIRLIARYLGEDEVYGNTKVIIMM